MVSQAGTGFSFNTKRSRLWEKLTLLHYDPVGKIPEKLLHDKSKCFQGLLPFSDDVEQRQFCGPFVTIAFIPSVYWKFTLVLVTVPGAGIFMDIR